MKRERDDSVRWFGTGNCLVFGTMGVAVDKERGLESWKKGVALARAGESEALEAETCGKILDLSGLLRAVVLVDGDEWQDGVKIGDEEAVAIGAALERNATTIALNLSGVCGSSGIVPTIDGAGLARIGAMLQKNATITKVQLGCGCGVWCVCVGTPKEGG